MFRFLPVIVICYSMVCFGAQGSGAYIEGQINRGVHIGDTLYAGIIDGFYPVPVEYQYSVRYAFTIGYEQSFSKILSLRGGVGYRNSLLDSYGGIIENNGIERPVIAREIERHWLTIPLDCKVTLPIRRSGLYVAAGPKVSILLSSTYTDSIQNEERNVTDGTPRFNIAVGGTVGFEFATGDAGHLFIESGYHYALVNTSIVPGKKMKESDITLLALGFRVNILSKKE